MRRVFFAGFFFVLAFAGRAVAHSFAKFPPVSVNSVIRSVSPPIASSARPEDVIAVSVTMDLWPALRAPSRDPPRADRGDVRSAAVPGNRPPPRGWSEIVDAERLRRVAENESTFRWVNERIAQAHARLPFDDGQEFVCECGDTACANRVFLTLAEYETVRSHPTRFAVLPRHVIPDVERVVESHAGFVVVEKTGEGADRARQLDPRGDGE